MNHKPDELSVSENEHNSARDYVFGASQGVELLFSDNRNPDGQVGNSVSDVTSQVRQKILPGRQLDVDEVFNADDSLIDPVIPLAPPENLDINEREPRIGDR